MPRLFPFAALCLASMLPPCAIAAKNIAPAVTLTAPINGATFTAPATITLSAVASDSDGTIAKVEFYRSGTLISTATTAPYTTVWSNVPAGSYTLTAKATDLRGATKTSSAVTITVTAVVNTPPSVTLTDPVPGSRYSAPAMIALSASATDTDGSISKVEFFEGSTLLGAATAAPYTITWMNVPAGSYTLTARATDNQGTAATSTPVSIAVGAANLPPLVAISAPASCGIFDTETGIDLVAEAVDPDGDVIQVDYYAGSTLIGSVPNNTPYRDLRSYPLFWRGMGPGTYTIIAHATDKQGASTASAPITLAVTAANQPPQVALTTPAAGAVFAANTPITITADAWDGDGSVTQVIFYDTYGGWSWLGTANAPPFTIVWGGTKQAGQHTLLALATDNRGAQTASAEVPITISANALPSVSLTAPVSGSTYFAPATMQLNATAADSDGSIAKVEFFQGSTLIGTATSAPYAYTWAGVGAGSYSLTAKATDNSGASTASTAVNVTVNANAPPTVSLTAPAPGSTYFAPATMQLNATAADSDGSIAKVEFFQGSTLIGTATIAPYAYTWTNVAAGSYTITAKATDNLGIVTTSTPVTITINALQLAIDSPANAETLNGNSTLISGTFQGPANTGITVNGVLAATDANHFYAEIPVTPGQDTITATLTTATGQAAEQSIAVNSDGAIPVVQIRVDELELIYPQKVNFTISNSGNTDATVTQTNGGASWTVSAGGSLTLTYPFPAPGSYPISLAVDGGGPSKNYVIVVKDPLEIDALLKGVYYGMLDKLKASDVDAAMQAFNGSAHDKYLAVFNALGPNLATVVDQLGTLQAGTFSAKVADYPLVRNTSSGNESFSVYFLRGEDGVWRIDGM